MFSDSRGIEPLRALMDADGAERVMLSAVSAACSGIGDSRGIEPLTALRGADDAERVMLSAVSAACSGLAQRFERN